MFSLLHSRYNSLFLQRDYIITDKYRFFQPYLSEPQCWSAPSDLPNLPRGVLILNILNFVLGGNLFQIQGPFLHLYVSSPKSIWKRANRPLKLMAIPCQWLVHPTQQKKKKKSILSNFKFLYLKQIGTCYFRVIHMRWQYKSHPVWLLELRIVQQFSVLKSKKVKWFLHPNSWHKSEWCILETKNPTTDSWRIPWLMNYLNSSESCLESLQVAKTRWCPLGDGKESCRPFPVLGHGL